MHYPDSPGVVANHFGPNKPGYTDGDPATGALASVWGAAMGNDLVGNLMRLIEIAGTGASKGNIDDLNRAIQALITLAIPNQSIAPGTILMFGGIAAPGGWLLCDGATASRAGFGNLFAAIGTAYGAGDGATTFQLPDLRGRAAIGAGQGSGLTNRALGAMGGEEQHLLSLVEMPLHGHPWRHCVANQSTTGSGPTGGVVTSAGTSQNEAAYTGAATGTSGQQIGGEGGGGAHNTMQPFLAVNHIIKF